MLLWFSILSCSETITQVIDGIECLFTIGDKKNAKFGNESIIFNKSIHFFNEFHLPSDFKYNNKDYTVSEISDYAFYNLPAYQIFIPQTITKIGKYSFASDRLVKLDLSKTTIDVIPDFCFHNTRSLRVLKLPKVIRIIGYKAFFKSQISHVIIPKTVEIICSKAFCKSSILELDLRNTNVRILNNTVFENCSLLKSITLPRYLQQINNRCFAYSAIRELNISQTLQTIQEGSFELMTNLEKINYNFNNIKEIPNNCFNGCSSLISISLSNSIESIGNYSFASCKFEKIIFPKSLKTIGNCAFKSCPYLQEISFEGTGIKKIGEESFCKSILLYKVVLSDTIEYIGSAAFKCTMVSDMIIPKSIIYIGKKCFSNCRILQKINFTSAKKLTKFDDKLFYNCNSLETIIFPENLRFIGQNVFSFTKITEINLNLQEMDILAFADMDQVQSIDLENSTFNVLPSHSFFKCLNLISLKLPKTIEKIQENCFKYCPISDIILRDNLIHISKYTFSYTNFEVLDFSNCSKIMKIPMFCFQGSIWLKTVVLPPNLCIIKDFAFYECTNLEKIEFSRNLTSIGIGCFGNCIRLESIDMSNLNITILSQSLFENCTRLNLISLSNETMMINEMVFFNTSIKTLKLPSSVKNVSDFAFYGMFNLEKIDLSNTKVTKIFQNTFSDCFSLKSIHLPSELAEIEHSAFLYCSELSFIYYCGKYNFSNHQIFSVKPKIYVTQDYPAHKFGMLRVRRSNICFSMSFRNKSKNIKINQIIGPPKPNKRWQELLLENRVNENPVDTSFIIKYDNDFENDEVEIEPSYSYDEEESNPTPTPTENPHKNRNEENQFIHQEQSGHYLDDDEDNSAKFILIFIVFAIAVGIFALFMQELKPKQINANDIESMNTQTSTKKHKHSKKSYPDFDSSDSFQ